VTLPWFHGQGVRRGFGYPSFGTSTVMTDASLAARGSAAAPLGAADTLISRLRQKKMVSPIASKVSLTLSPAQWKTIQSLIYATAQQQTDAHLTDRAKRVVEQIESAKQEASRQGTAQVVFTMVPSGWRSLQAFLRPRDALLKRDALKDQKEKVIRLIQTVIDAARQRVIVTTGDLQQPYEIIGPVYFQVSNKGILSSDLDVLSQRYQAEINEMRTREQIGKARVDWSFLYGEFSVGQSRFERAFFVAVQELKKRALLLDADAIVCMRQDIDLDTNAFQFFYLQIYGTAIRLSSS